MDDLKLVQHAQGAPGLRFIGMGPNIFPSKGLLKLKRLLDENTLWAQKRTTKDIKIMLSKSNVIVSLWKKKQLIGFGRATTDHVYRAILWDIVIDKNFQRNGFGSMIVNSIISNKLISKVEKIYLMTTDCKEFYLKMGFTLEKNQKLLILKKNK